MLWGTTHGAGTDKGSEKLGQVWRQERLDGVSYRGSRCGGDAKCQRQTSENMEKMNDGDGEGASFV
jgi:hypothetical protein